MRRLEQIQDQVPQIRLVTGEGATPIHAITYDSRQVKAGTLFVALRGERFDGHDFLERAVEQGASALLVDDEFLTENDLPRGVALLAAPDTRAVLARLGCAFYDWPSRQMTLVGITGTNGKTSTTYLLEAIFRGAGHRVGVIGTVEYRWGTKRVEAPNTTPDGLVLQKILRTMADDGIQVVILEVSSHGLESGRVEGVDFDAGLFTNLSQDHLDYHRSMEAYRDAKRRLFLEVLPASKTRDGDVPLALVNVDDEEGQNLCELLKERQDQRLISFGLGREEAQFRAAELILDVTGVEMKVVAKGEAPFWVSSPMPGNFSAENLLGAVALARSMNLSAPIIKRGLADFKGVPGRMERVGRGGLGPAVFVDFAHTPEALMRALETLRPLTTGQLWVVFGCGGDRDRAKRPLMGAIAARSADKVVLTSDNPRGEPPEAIIDAIEEGLISVFGDDSKPERRWLRSVDRAEAIELALERASGDDVVLIAGKGHEDYQEIAGVRRPFDDREVAARALSRRGQI